MWNLLFSSITCLYGSQLFGGVLVWFLILCLKVCLIYNFLLKNDKMVKPVLLAFFFSCLVSVVNVQELFKNVFICFLIYLFYNSWKLQNLYLTLEKCFCCKSNFPESLVMPSIWYIYFMNYASGVNCIC